MTSNKQMDAAGAAALVTFSLLLAFNQVVIKVGNDGFQPVFFAAIRSMGGAICMYIWIRMRGQRLEFPKGTIKWGLLIGVVFSIEFIGLFVALDLTTVARTSVIFYSMPLWLALAAHFVLPGETLHPTKILGLIIAFAGVSWAVLDRHGIDGKDASIIGDLCALVGAWTWAGVALIVRATPLNQVRPEMQNFWQLSASIPLLFLAALFFGPFIRDIEPIHFWALSFQIVVVVSAGYLFWIWLLTIYRAAEVAAFSFLSPLFGIALGWLILDEKIGFSLLFAGGLVAVGLILINRPARR